MEKSDSNEILDTGNLVASTRATRTPVGTASRATTTATTTAAPAPATTVAPATTAAETEQIKLVNVPVTDDNVAFNLVISFLNLAQRRGVYTIDESAKIWECVKRFQRPS
jgi:3-oxoacyl-ACP reductase-like protein